MDTTGKKKNGRQSLRNVRLSLSFKTSQSAKFCYEYQFSFILKLELITMKKISHLDSLSKKDWGQFWNGPFSMALFLPNKELFTNFVMFNHAWKHEEDRWNYFQCHTKPNLRVATILAWYWWLCYLVNWKITSFSYSS